jgi:hypothetical protein
MVSKSYLNTCYRELGHLCPSGILRSISLSPTTCLSTWRYHSLFITTSLLVQVGLISLGCLFNTLGTTINPYLEFTQSSPHQDTLAASRCTWLNNSLPLTHISLPIYLSQIPSSHLLTYLTHSHQPPTPLSIYTPSHQYNRVVVSSSSPKPIYHPFCIPSTIHSWRPMLDHAHISPLILTHPRYRQVTFYQHSLTSTYPLFIYYP